MMDIILYIYIYMNDELSKITNLLSAPSLDTSLDTSLDEIKRVMTTYIASPWDSVNKKIMEEHEYFDIFNEYKKQFNHIN